MNGGTVVQMYRKFRSKNELYEVVGNTVGIVEGMLKEWATLPIREYQNNVDCLADSLLKIPYDELPCQEDRNYIVEVITETQFKLFGTFPSINILNKLGDFILLDYIKSKTKSKFDDNTFHTPKQLKRRLAKECSTEADTMDFLHGKMTLRIPSLYKKTKKTVE